MAGITEWMSPILTLMSLPLQWVSAAVQQTVAFMVEMLQRTRYTPAQAVHGCRDPKSEG
jgi:hypothetical protein